MRGSPIVVLVALLGLPINPMCVRAGAVVDPKLARADPKKDVLWYDVQKLTIEGKGWQNTKEPFDRLPAKAEKMVRPAVWGLSRDSAGICVRFVTNAPEIHARWTLRSKRLEMVHMPATGVSGLDLYVQGKDGKWRWLGIGRPTGQTSEAVLVDGIPAGERNYLLYLPLYNGVTAVEVGIAKKYQLAKAEARSAQRQKPIVFYGTSITQGGCASRPGMVHTAILGRWLDYPVINLGFSGNGRMEPEIGQLMSEIDAAAYVIDCLPNMNGKEVSERTEPLVRQLRQARPQTPIVLVEDRSYTNSFLRKGLRQRNEENRAALRSAFEKLKKAQVTNLYYIPGEDLLGDDTEGTVDSSHPTDLGFLRQAEAFQRVLRPMLAK